MKKITSVIILALVGTIVYASAVPLNNDFVNREIITGSNGSVAGWNTDATLEPGEKHYGNSNTVWWTWTPPTYAVYQIDTFGSSFDTYLTVFYGDVLTSLYVETSNNDALGTQQSAVCLKAGSGTDFYIQVSGDNAGDVGTITLNWHTVTTWCDWIFSHNYTDSYFTVAFGDDLSALSFPYMQAWTAYYRTNELGCEDWKYESSYVYTNGFTITDKNNNKIIDNELPEGISTNFSFHDFNGKQVILYDRDSNTLIIYKVKKGAFVKSGEKTIDNFGHAWFDSSEIGVFLYDDTGEGISAYDKKLKKEKWIVPIAEGDVKTLGNGLVAHEVRSNDVLNITCRKKGKKVVSRHSITNLPDTNLYLEYDSKGGILYWTKKSGTNSPLTYIDRKGEKILNNESMTDVGDVWDFQGFDGKILYVLKPLGSGSNTFYVYKVKGLKNLGKKNVGGCPSLDANGKAYIFTYFGAGNGVIVCDKKLKKEKWSEQPADGNIRRLTKEIFIRLISTTVGDNVTETYKIFNRKGEIVTYIFSYTK